MDKNIDESYKKAVEKEKETVATEGKTGEPLHFLKADFNAFVSSMAMEALIFLGELPNPVSKKKEMNLDQARYVIDTLSILKEKTKGNLSEDEANNLDNILYELRTAFVAKSK